MTALIDQRELKRLQTNARRRRCAARKRSGDRWLGFALPRKHVRNLIAWGYIPDEDATAEELKDGLLRMLDSTD